MPTLANSKRSRQVARPRLTSWVGIDIGTSGVKIVEAIHRRSGPRWVSRAYRKFKPALSGSMIDPADIAKMLSDELPRAADGKYRPAVVSLPSSWCVSQPVNVETLDSIGSQMVSELGGHAQWCAWQLPQGNGPQFAMSYGVSGELAESVAVAVNKAGHRCVRIDAQPLALHRAISLVPSDTTPSCILDWGWESCVLVVCTDEGPGLVRTLPNCGLRYLVEGASERLDCDGTTVLRMLRQRAADEKDADEKGRRSSDQAYDLLAPHTKKMADEISQSLRYANRIGCEPLGGPLMVCGGGGALPAVRQLISSHMDLSVLRWSWHGEKALHSSPWTPPDSMFAVAMSLACGDTYA